MGKVESSDGIGPKVLHKVKQGHLTQTAAAEQLGISERWVRGAAVCAKNELTAVVHGLRGKPISDRIGF